MTEEITHWILHQQIIGKEKSPPLEEGIFHAISERIYSYLTKKWGIDQDELSSILLRLYTKLPGIVQRFQGRNAHFYTYLYSTVEWEVRSFRREKEIERKFEWVCEQEASYTYELPPEEKSEIPLGEKIYTILQESGLKGRRLEVLRQRLLFLVLRNTFFYSEDDFLSTFPLLGPSKREGIAYRKSILKSLQPRWEKQERLNLQKIKKYHRLFIHQEESRKLAQYGINKEPLERKILGVKKQLESLGERSRRNSLTPSHRHIANLLKIPQGTVDSGIYYIRKDLENLYPKIAKEAL